MSPSSTSSEFTPVIAGFYPDPSICRVGDDLYLANSSFEYTPGVPIWHSRDLVSWRQVGNALGTERHLAAGIHQPDKGVYAPTLRHHGGRFWMITTVVDAPRPGHIVVSAERPEGPWSDPVTIPLGGIDPDLFWEPDGTALVTYCETTDGPVHIAQAAVDLATGRVLESPRTLWSGTGLAHPEGPHLYRIGDWWYLLIAEGGTERGHTVAIARGASPRGPFEGHPANPILSHRSLQHRVHSTGHADLVEGPDGWAMVFLGVRPTGWVPGFHVLGRETFVAAVDWIAEWPEVREGAFEVPTPAHGFVDRFRHGPLDPRWVSPGARVEQVAEPGPGGATLRAVAAPNGSWSGLYARVRDERWQAEAEVDARAGSVGLGVRLDDAHWCEIAVGGGVAKAVASAGTLTNEATVPVGDGPATLVVRAVDPTTLGPDDLVLAVRAHGEERELLRFDGRYLSTEVAAGFTGRVVGVRCVEGEATVASFTYTPES